MKLKDFKILFVFVFFTQLAFTQNVVKGFVFNSLNQKGLKNIRVIDKVSGKTLTKTNLKGEFTIKTDILELHITFITKHFETKELKLNTRVKKIYNIPLDLKREELNVIQINTIKKQQSDYSILKDVEETAIYAGKKTEVVLMENSMANLATNNARQIYNKISGLNIFQNDDGGLQLNIGGRGLDPNRTSNFNTKQNGYDISADVLGYPESYYSPPSEALKKVEVIRGAAALQYGTQFGGLINFKLKEPNKNKPIELLTRNTVGSYGLYTNFTSLSGTKNKFSYYSYINYKKGNGFRPNSDYNSKNIYAYFKYKLNKKTTLSTEVTYFTYLAHQAGGLSDRAFKNSPYSSNRERNWFKVNWLLLNAKLSHNFSEKTKLSLNAFALKASRDAIGFRSNRVDQIDPNEERDLIKGTYNNFGLESRLLHNYKIGSKKSVFLIGNKFYKAKNTALQGPGSNGSDANFNLYSSEFPNYPNQNNYTFPNLNIAFFSENIFYLNKKLSITPGVRFEYIDTKSDGEVTDVITDLVGGIVISKEVKKYNDSNTRKFVLLGMGSSYKVNKNIEIYSNLSQNYKSVTFSDISIVNPSFVIDENITDENGYSFDLGVRGKFNSYLRYDATAFALIYNNRIGQINVCVNRDGEVVDCDTRDAISTKVLRTNVGDGLTYGIESMFEFDLSKLFLKNNFYTLKYFTNIAVLNSEYLESIENGIEGNTIEFVPRYNLKTGLKFGYRKLIGNIQYTYLSDQFSDATNAIDGGITGIEGIIPAYSIIDLSLKYNYKRYTLETGVNNLMNNAYFTRRATGYPGPGIIPSAPRNYFLTLEIKI